MIHDFNWRLDLFKIGIVLNTKLQTNSLLFPGPTDRYKRRAGDYQSWSILRVNWLIFQNIPVSTGAMFTLYRIVKRSVAESVPDRASVHTRTAAFEAVSAPEQYCSAPLLKVERSVSDRFLRRSESSLNTFIGAEIATEPRFGKLSFQIKRERYKLHNG